MTVVQQNLQLGLQQLLLRLIILDRTKLDLAKSEAQRKEKYQPTRTIKPQLRVVSGQKECLRKHCALVVLAEDTSLEYKQQFARASQVFVCFTQQQLGDMFSSRQNSNTQKLGCIGLLDVTPVSYEIKQFLQAVAENSSELLRFDFKIRKEPKKDVKIVNPFRRQRAQKSTPEKQKFVLTSNLQLKGQFAVAACLEIGGVQVCTTRADDICVFFEENGQNVVQVLGYATESRVVLTRQVQYLERDLARPYSILLQLLADYTSYSKVFCLPSMEYLCSNGFIVCQDCEPADSTGDRQPESDHALVGANDAAGEQKECERDPSPSQQQISDENSLPAFDLGQLRRDEPDLF